MIESINSFDFFSSVERLHDFSYGLESCVKVDPSLGLSAAAIAKY